MKQPILILLCGFLLLVSLNLVANPIPFPYSPSPLLPQAIVTEPVRQTHKRIQRLQKMLHDYEEKAPLSDIGQSVLLELYDLESRLMARTRPLAVNQLRNLVMAEQWIKEGIQHYRQSQSDYALAYDAKIQAVVLSLINLANLGEQTFQDRYLRPEVSAMLDRGQMAGAIPGLSDVVTEQTVVEASGLFGARPRPALEDIDYQSPRERSEGASLPGQSRDARLRQLATWRERLEQLLKKQAEPPSPTVPFAPEFEAAMNWEQLTQREENLQRSVESLTNDIGNMSLEQKDLARQQTFVQAELKRLDMVLKRLRPQVERSSHQIDQLMTQPEQVSNNKLDQIGPFFERSDFQAFRQSTREQQLRMLMDRKYQLEERMEKQKEKLLILFEKQNQYLEEQRNISVQQQELIQVTIDLDRRESWIKQKQQGLTAELTSIEHELDQIGEELSLRQADLDRYFRDKQVLEDRLAGLRDRALEKKSRIDELRSLLDSVRWDNGVSVWETEQGTVRRDLDYLRTLEREHNVLIGTVSNGIMPQYHLTKESLDSVSDRIDQARHLRETIEKQETVYFEQLSQTRRELVQLEDAQVQLTKERKQLSTAETELKEEHKTLSDQIDVIEHRRKHISGSLTQESDQVREMSELSVKLAKDLDIKARLHQMRQRMRKLKKELTASEESFSQQEARQNEYMQRQQTIAEYIADKSEERQRLESQLQRAKAELDSIPPPVKKTVTAQPRRSLQDDCEIDDLQRRIREETAALQGLQQETPREPSTGQEVVDFVPGRVQRELASDPDETIAFEIQPVRPGTDSPTTRFSSRLMNIARWVPVLNKLLFNGAIVFQGSKMIYYYHEGWYRELEGDSDFFNTVTLLNGLQTDIDPSDRQCPVPDPETVLMNLAYPAAVTDRSTLADKKKKTAIMVYPMYGQYPVRKEPGFTAIEKHQAPLFNFMAGVTRTEITSIGDVKPAGYSLAPAKVDKPSRQPDLSGFTPASKPFGVSPVTAASPSIPPTIPDPLGFTPAPKPIDVSPVATAEAPHITPPIPDPAPSPVVAPQPETVAIPENYSGSTALMVHPSAQSQTPSVQPLTVDEVIEIIRPKTLIGPALSGNQTTALAIRYDEKNLYKPVDTGHPPILQDKAETLGQDEESDKVTLPETETDAEKSHAMPSSPKITPPEVEPESSEAAPEEQVSPQPEPSIQAIERVAVMNPLVNREIAPELALMTSLSHLTGVVQMTALSGIRNLSSRIWKSYRLEQNIKGWLQPEILSFAYNQSQLSSWENNNGLYSFVQGFNQSGTYSSNPWGGSGFSWGTVGFIEDRLMAGIILSRQKVQVADPEGGNKLSVESNHFYSLLSWQGSGFEIVSILGAGWPDYKYRGGQASDKFSGDQWLGYLAVSQRFSLPFQFMELGITPVLECFKISSHTDGHASSGFTVPNTGIYSSGSSREIVQAGLVLDTDSSFGRQSQSWQLYIGWQQARGKQGVAYSNLGDSGYLNSRTETSNNMIFSLGATRRLANHLTLQLSFHGSQGDLGGHHGLNIGYTQQF